MSSLEIQRSVQCDTTDSSQPKVTATIAAASTRFNIQVRGVSGSATRFFDSNKKHLDTKGNFCWLVAVA